MLNRSMSPRCLSGAFPRARGLHLVNFVYLSTREAAAKLSIGTSTLKKYRVQGGGPVFHRIGRRVVYSSDVLDEWARRDTFKTTSEYRQERRS
jgi:hypothetical protein